MFAGLLFDLDGTLADTERENAESVGRALGRRSRVLAPDEDAYIVGHGWREIYAFLEANRPTGYSFEELKRAAAEEKIALVRERGLRVLPGARDVFARIGANAALGVVTGSARMEAEFVLDELGVRAALRCLVAAEDTERGKPSPDGYLLAAERLHLPAADCLVIEDSSAGIAAAHAAGMACVAVAAGNFAGQDQSGADLRVATLADLTLIDLAALARLRARG